MLSIPIRILILLFGTLYPAFASYKSVRDKDVTQYVYWMMYWIVYALFRCIEDLVDFFFSWFPFYYSTKLLFLLWLMLPSTHGSYILYRKFVHPFFKNKEKDIDAFLQRLKCAGAPAIWDLGCRGYNIMQGLFTELTKSAKAAQEQHQLQLPPKEDQQYSKVQYNIDDGVSHDHDVYEVQRIEVKPARGAKEKKILKRGNSAKKL